MTTIVNFPTSRIVREVQPNIEEIEKVKEKGKQNFADGILVDFIDSTLGLLENYGVDTDGTEFERDFSFAIDAVKASIYRSMGLKHHLHDFIDNNVTVIKKDDQEKLEIDISKELEEILVEDVNDIGKVDSTE